MMAYPTMRAPVRLVAGNADLVVSTALHARPVAHLIPGARLERLPDAGHMLHHTHGAAVVRAALSLR